MVMIYVDFELVKTVVAKYMKTPGQCLEALLDLNSEEKSKRDAARNVQDTQDPADYVLTFGRFNGQTLAQIYLAPAEVGQVSGHDYLKWVAKTILFPKTVAKVKAFLEYVSVVSPPSSPVPRKRQCMDSDDLYARAFVPETPPRPSLSSAPIILGPRKQGAGKEPRHLAKQ